MLFSKRDFLTFQAGNGTMKTQHDSTMSIFCHLPSVLRWLTCYSGAIPTLRHTRGLGQTSTALS